MTEPYVTLTDYGLSIECLTFLVFLVRLRSTRRLRLWFLVFFSSLAASSFIGGTVHGFFAQPSSAGGRVLWPMTMVGIGVTALAGIQIAKGLLWAERNATITDAIIYAAFCIYCGVVLFVDASFLVAILGYLPAILLLAWALMKEYLRSGHRRFLTGFLGLLVILFGSVIQQIRILDSSHYVNRNVLYHIFQGIGLFMLFVSARSIEEREKGKELTHLCQQDANF
jgi:hypothetical protein